MIRSEHAHLKVAAATHPGMTGKNNEDRYSVSAYQVGPDNAAPSLLAVLCDGIGGHRAGEVAAELAVNIISQAVAASDATQPVEVLQDAIQAASTRIYAESQSNSERKGMGSTCACAWIIGSRLYTVSVGDSRIYLLRGDAICQLTTDHTVIQELLDRGQITPAEVRGNPNAHIIRRYLGSAAPPEPDFRLRLKPDENDDQAISNQGLTLRKGDRLLLCSDGLTDLVADEEILEALDRRPAPARARHPAPPKEQDLEGRIQELVALANQRGGHDNITIVVLQVDSQGAPEPRPAFLTRTWRLAAVGCLGFIVIGLVAGAAVLGLPWLQGLLHVTPDSQNTPPAITQTALAPGNLFPSGTPTLSQLTTTAIPVATQQTLAPSIQPTSGPTLTPWPTNTLPAATDIVPPRQ